MEVPMEDLTSQADLHYFRAIKGGSVEIVKNVDAVGKPNLKFRQLDDVYNQENIKNDELIPRIQPEVVRNLDNVSELSEGECMFDSETKPEIISEPEDFNMTLETIRKTCKKRKPRNHRDTETASNVEVKQYDLTKGFDLEDTELSKRRKKNHKHKTKSDSSSSPSVIKVGVPETCEDSYSVSKAMDFISTDPECPTVTEVVEEIICHKSKDTRLPHCSPEDSLGGVATEEPRTTKPVDKGLTDASEEFNDPKRKTQNCLAENIALENQEMVFHCSVSREETESVVLQSSESEVPRSSESEIISYLPISSNTSSGCEEVKEDEENNDSNPSLSINSTGLEIMKKLESPETLAINYSGLPTLGFEVENIESVWETEDIAMDDHPEATGNLQSVADDSTISLEEVQSPERLQEQPASSGNVDEAGDLNAPNEVKTDAETNQPEKLLSGRKALSPTSQAKLLKAMECPKRNKKSRGKFYFSKQTSHRILEAQGLENIDRVELIQKPNKKATHKLPCRDTQPTKPEPFSSGCTSLKVCSGKAISFSQGQVRDFHDIASKLTEEIKTMRQFTKRCLITGSNTSNMSGYNPDQVKTLIKNSERTEKKSNRLLSVIERDCNRFCTIMGMVEDSPVTQNIDEKRKKKIKFADDEGEDLCHVKLFDIDMESES